MPSDSDPSPQQGPRFLIRDNDGKFGHSFDALAHATGIQILRTPVRAPNANAVCERFLRSVRAECLDHVIILGAGSLTSILQSYCRYFNGSRPHQGIGQRVPDGPRRTHLPTSPSWRSRSWVASTMNIGVRHSADGRSSQYG